MAEINLERDEVIVTKQEKVIKRLGFLSKQKGDLILTNHRLVWKVRALLADPSNYTQYSIGDIKVYDNKAQAKAEYINSRNCLTIYFQTGEEVFDFEFYMDAQVFANHINHVVTGTHEDIYPFGKQKGEKGIILSAIESTVDAISSAIYRNKSKHMTTPVTLVPPLIGAQASSVPKPKPKKVAKKCMGCHAPLTGFEGDEIICVYCNTKQVL